MSSRELLTKPQVAMLKRLADGDRLLHFFVFLPVWESDDTRPNIGTIRALAARGLLRHAGWLDEGTTITVISTAGRKAISAPLNDRRAAP